MCQGLLGDPIKRLRSQARQSWLFRKLRPAVVIVECHTDKCVLPLIWANWGPQDLTEQVANLKPNAEDLFDFREIALRETGGRETLINFGEGLEALRIELRASRPPAAFSGDAELLDYRPDYTVCEAVRIRTPTERWTWCSGLHGKRPKGPANPSRIIGGTTFPHVLVNTE
jgi:hypothetical protein